MNGRLHIVPSGLHLNHRSLKGGMNGTTLNIFGKVSP